MDNLDQVIRDIKTSKKYRGVYQKTIERIVAGFALTGKNPEEVEKKSKNLLHQIWGAFYVSRPDFGKLLVTLEENVKNGAAIKGSLLPILQVQSSVKERVPILDGFYKKIFEITGVPNSIIDYACGLNPLTYFWMDLPQETRYKAFDIDEEQTDFLNNIFNVLRVKNVQVAAGDILSDGMEYADVVFLLKLLPCLEHQKKNCSLDILKNLECKYVVVSFPAKSLGGKKAGMAGFYSNNFKNMVKDEGWEVSELLFDTELVFVIKK